MVALEHARRCDGGARKVIKRAGKAPSARPFLARSPALKPFPHRASASRATEIGLGSWRKVCNHSAASSHDACIGSSCRGRQGTSPRCIAVANARHGWPHPPSPASQTIPLARAAPLPHSHWFRPAHARPPSPPSPPPLSLTLTFSYSEIDRNINMKNTLDRNRIARRNLHLPNIC